MAEYRSLQPERQAALPDIKPGRTTGSRKEPRCFGHQIAENQHSECDGANCAPGQRPQHALARQRPKKQMQRRDGHPPDKKTAATAAEQDERHG